MKTRIINKPSPFISHTIIPECHFSFKPKLKVKYTVVPAGYNPNKPMSWSDWGRAISAEINNKFKENLK